MCFSPVDIMNKVKDDLEYYEEYDYVIKADVLNIIVNKIEGLKSDDIELDDKKYRWKGFSKVKHNNKYDTIYDK